METQIRKVLQEHAKLPVPVTALQDSDDLYKAGLTSHASVNVMLAALEDEFDVEFPQSVLRKRTFESIDAIRNVLTELVSAAQH